MVKGLLGVVIGLVCYIIVIQLVETLVTGTATGDTIIQNILALAVAIGVKDTGAFSKKLLKQIGQIRGSLNLARGKVIAEPSRREISGRVERLDGRCPTQRLGQWYSPTLSETRDNSKRDLCIYDFPQGRENLIVNT